MSVPPEIKRLLSKHSVSHGQEPTEHECEGSKFHSPRPLRVHSVLLYDSHLKYLCGTCRDNLSVFLQLWDQEGGLDWPTQRLFGNGIRSMAQLVIAARKGHQ